jgi:hypothetical protein
MAIAFTHSASVSHGHTSGARYGMVFAASVLALGLAGFAIGYLLRPPNALEPELARLLRLMALIKLGLVASASWLIVWRLSRPCAPHLARSYLIAVALMTVSPGLIWYLSHLRVAFGLFHAGLALGLIQAFRDGEPLRVSSFLGSEYSNDHL